MKKTYLKFIVITLIVASSTLQAQVGIGTIVPAATADITALNPTGVATNVDGILIPRVDRQRAQGMLAVPNATMIYVNSIATGAAAGQASNITSIGFYYFDTALLPAPGKWVKIESAGNNWSILGNTGTTAGTNFIGTTDNVDLVFKRNNIIAGSLGVNNTSYGVNSLVSNTTGTSNTAIGNVALQSNTGGSSSTAIGSQALQSNTTGVNNTAIGREALSLNTIGGDNVALGLLAGQNNTTGDQNTFIGSRTDATISNLTNATALGYNTKVSQSNTVILGNNANVGIGTTTPSVKSSLDISSTTAGVLFPRVTTVQRTAIAPAGTDTGLKVYDTTTKSYWYWDGTVWVEQAANNKWTLTGNAGTTAGTNFIGTTDAQDFRIKTGVGGVDRWNISNANSGQLQSYALGTALLPTYSWQTDTNTGIWSPAADNIAVSTAGLERTRILANGNMGIQTTNPLQALHIGGSAAGLQTLRIDDIAVTAGGTNPGELAPTITTSDKALYADSNGDVRVRSIYGDNTQSTILAAGTQNISTNAFVDITGATITFTPKHSTVYLSFAISGYNPLTGTSPRGWFAVRIMNGATNAGNFVTLTATNDAGGSNGAATVSSGNFPLTVVPGVPVTIKLQGRVSAAILNAHYTIDKTNYTSYMTILD
ncbi:hypothetical protein [Flavobacterium sp.]|uniref:hypothetical protein n=1 Tax=Flavobacterium sp. TaxID=239 RepID=UPI00374DB71D